MKRHLAVAAVLTVAAIAFYVTPAWADTPASCSTDTATTYCAQLDTGTRSDASLDGFAIAEATMGTLIGGLGAFIVLKKLFAAAGWGAW